MSVTEAPGLVLWQARRVVEVIAAYQLDPELSSWEVLTGGLANTCRTVRPSFGFLCNNSKIKTPLLVTADLVALLLDLMRLWIRVNKCQQVSQMGLNSGSRMP